MMLACRSTKARRRDSGNGTIFAVNVCAPLVVTATKRRLGDGANEGFDALAASDLCPFASVKSVRPGRLTSVPEPRLCRLTTPCQVGSVTP
jgi:hypothetical protein